MTLTHSARSTAASDDVTSSDRARWGALGGVVFVVVSVVANFIPGTAPASDASAAKITSYFKDHSGAIKLQLFVSGVAIVFLLWWFGTLWRSMTRVERQRPHLVAIASVSFPIGISLALMSGVLTATAAVRVDSLGDGTQLLYTLSLVTISAAGFAMAAWIGAVCALNARASMLPAWTNYIGWLAAAAFLGSGLGVASDANAFALLGLLAFLTWCGWIVSVSITMWQRTR